MITVTLNDKTLTLEQPISLGRLLAQQGISPAGKAAALNNLNIPMAQWDSTLLKDGDNIIIFRAFYGG